LECEDPVSIRVTEDTQQIAGDGKSWLRRPKLYKGVVEPYKKKKKKTHNKEIGRYRSDLVGVQTRRSRGLYLFLWMKIMNIVSYGQDIFTTEDLMCSYESKILYRQDVT